MYVSPEQIADTNKASVEALIGLATTQFAAMERLSALNFNAAKSALEDSVSYAKSLLAAKDAQEFASLSTAAAQPVLEKAIAYSRGVYEIATQTQADMSKFAEQQAGQFNKNVAGYLDKVSKDAPAGSDVAIAAVKSALAAANSAYDSISRVTKQASEIAETNFNAAATVLKEGKKKAA
ncbi:MAG: granule-associated-like protein [Betaproteobacteria bacterium RIFCSPLOWO2_12_FULL_63_13]|nr:MAG: granule-associated-like protein [Betaproteobacteria bacterium RIFCSPLOWO2_02_FULL_63_19]OGA45521.1 MAG: granule-associated-like protein [Betaproteobacteria bacterium RIFCSPLOWO2_12_FULL_63_13]